MTRAHLRAFSLLEVMVAVAILGLTLTVILSAQGGLAASNKSAANMGLATTFGRCKMTEVEEKLLKLGYPLMDDVQTDVACCDDQADPSFVCDTRVEKVVLPNPPTSSLDGGAMSLSSLASAAPSATGSGAAGIMGMLGSALGTAAPAASFNPMVNPLGGAGLDLDGGGLQGLGNAMTAQMAPGGLGTQGLLQMVMGIVYPSMKILFEASIRRVTITVRWHEGPNDKELSLVQYVTNPQMAGFMAGAAPSASAAASGGAPPAINATPPGPGGFGGTPTPAGRPQY